MTAAVVQNVLAAVGGLPSIEFSSVAPSIILALAGVLLLTVVSVTKDKLLEAVSRGLRHVQLLRERDHARQMEMQLLKNLASA